MKVPFATFGVIGIAIGALSRDFGRFHQTVKLWPALDEVIDWNKVDDLLNNEANG